MSTSIYTGLNPFNFISNPFCGPACEIFLMDAVIAVFNPFSVRRSRYTDNQIYTLLLQVWTGLEGG
jgi:hypothetical protein